MPMLGRHRMAKLIKILPLLLATIPSVTSAQSSACATGTAVADPANNPGLVADCDTLLSVLDTLAGTPTLNWSASLPIDDWDGVSVAGRLACVSSVVSPCQELHRDNSGRPSQALLHVPMYRKLQ